jgi:hypothetical protein
MVLTVASDSGRRTIRFFREGTDCSDAESLAYLREVCSNYSKGLVPGSFCKSMCSEMVQYSKCLGHGVKPHVLLVKYKDKDVVLKAKRTYKSSIVKHKMREVEYLQDKHGPLLKFDQFATMINDTIKEVLFGWGRTYASKDVIDEFLLECDANSDTLISYHEAASCMRILASEEYVFYVLLRGIPGVPKVYGTCGNIFAVQSTLSDDLQDHVALDPRTWKKRALIAISMLDMVEAFEHTPYGTVYLCDVQEGNFGVDSSLKAYAIDMDISFFEGQISIMIEGQKKTKCTSDDTCDFISCWSKCNLSTNLCDPKLHSSNLQAICNNILLSDGSTDPGLLFNPPEKIADRLDELLETCGHPRHLIRYFNDTLVRSPPNVLNSLRSLLRESIKDT